MKIYLVGGAVRDEIMGKPVADRDWLVVGATPEQMVAQGFRPVGEDFPVFLHPETSEEYALARTERKTAPGYAGFVFHTDASVTVEEDLQRRDLTMNAIARLPEGGYVDPHSGIKDIRNKVLRHVGEAFAEDPVRILRIARFAARYADFSVAPETMDLMRSMVTSGEVDALVPERVWKELSRGLMESKPSRMLEVLQQTGALSRLLPEVEALVGVIQPEEHHPEIDTFVHVGMVLDQAAEANASLEVRFACLTHDLGKGTTHKHLLPKHHGHEERSAELLVPMAERLRVPTACKELAEVVAREHGNIHACLGLNSKAVGRLIARCDGFRKPERFEQLLQACEHDARGRLGLENRNYRQPDRLRLALEDALEVDTKAVAKRAMDAGHAGEKIGLAIKQARLTAIRQGEATRGVTKAPGLR